MLVLLKNYMWTSHHLTQKNKKFIITYETAKLQIKKIFNIQEKYKILYFTKIKKSIPTKNRLLF